MPERCGVFVWVRIKASEKKIVGTIGGAAVSIEAEARSLAFEIAEVRHGFFRWKFFWTCFRD